jgi:hypothetical protein
MGTRRLAQAANSQRVCSPRRRSVVSRSWVIAVLRSGATRPFFASCSAVRRSIFASCSATRCSSFASKWAKVSSFGSRRSAREVASTL